VGQALHSDGQALEKIETGGLPVYITCGNCTRRMDINDDACPHCKQKAPSKIWIKEPTGMTRFANFLIKAGVISAIAYYVYAWVLGPFWFDAVIQLFSIFMGVALGIGILLRFTVGNLRGYVLSREEYARREIEKRKSGARSVLPRQAG